MTAAPPTCRSKCLQSQTFTNCKSGLSSLFTLHSSIPLLRRRVVQHHDPSLRLRRERLGEGAERADEDLAKGAHLEVELLSIRRHALHQGGEALAATEEEI